MLNLMSSRTAAITIAGCTIIAAALSAQSASAPPSQPTSDLLLAEIKALRADLNQRLDASIRAQLLVARLQLQEQRISGLARQMSEVQQQLSQTETVRAPIEAQLKTFEAASAGAPQDEKKEGDFFVRTLRTQVETMTKNEEELKRQQLYLSGLMAEEQARWSAFNVRLEELERLLTPASPARDR